MLISRHVGVEGRLGATYAPARASRRGPCVVAVHQDGATPRMQVATTHFKKRGFPGAVATPQMSQGSLGESQCQIVQDGAAIAAVSGGDTAELKGRRWIRRLRH